MQETNKGIYLERSGKGGKHLAEILVAPPELPLDDDQKEKVYEFEDTIYNHQLDTGLTINELCRKYKPETVTTPKFFSEAFMRDKVDMSEVSGDKPLFNSSTDVYKWLATCAHDSTVDEAVLLKMAKDSANYYKQAITDLLVIGKTPEASVMDNMSIMINPSDTLNICKSAVEARQFLHDKRREYREGGDRLEGAKRVLTDVYLAKINSMVVSNITTLEYLADQSNLIGDEATKQTAEEIVPKIIRDGLESNKLKVLRALDYVKNGVGKDENRQNTVVDKTVLEENERKENLDNYEKPLFTPEQLDKLKSFKLSPEEMVKIFSNILDKAGLLSSEDPSTWSPKRPNRAADNLFQVVINPSANNFSVLPKSGAYKVASESRSLFDAIIVGGFHELEHVNQAQTDLELGKTLKIAELKGKRVSMFRESGANFKQRSAEKELFGESKPIALAYARALQVLEKGGDVFSATRAFYNEKRLTSPNSDPVTVAKEAADRVLRLTLHGGLNSQSMAYAEEVILDKELESATPEVKARAIAVTSIDLVDQVRLHKYDLLKLPENAEIDWTEIIMKEFEPYIVKALEI